MADFVVNPLSITYEQIRNDIRAMIANNVTTFTDFFNDASGSTVVDVAAALGAFFAYQIIAQRKEFTLEHATSYKSLISNAFDKGYCVTRGKNLRINLEVTPKVSGNISAWSIIGTYGDYNLTLVNSVAFTLGVPVTLEVILGNRKQASVNVQTSDITLFEFINDDITDDLKLYLNDTEISDYSTELADLANNKYVLLSNSYGGVNSFYLQNGDLKYKVGDVLTLDYISRNTIDFNSLAIESFNLTNFTVNNFSLASARVAREAKNSIRVRAALHSETSGIIRSRADFKKVLQEFSDNIKSVNDEDIQPGRINIYILKNDLTPLTQADKTIYEELIKSRTVSGVANTIYTNASKYLTDLNIQLITDSTINTYSNLLSEISEKISEYEYIISDDIDFDDIEKYIETQQGIKIARITVNTSTWTSNKNYQISDNCISTSFNNKAYYVSDFDLKSGSSEPTWVSDNITIDNDIIWKPFNGNPSEVMVWKPNIYVPIGRLVLSTNETDSSGNTVHNVYECVGYNFKSGSSKPNFKEVEATVIDNNLVWEKIEHTDNYKTYQTNTVFSVGDEIRDVYSTESEQSYEDKGHTQYYAYNTFNHGTIYTETSAKIGETFYYNVAKTQSGGAINNITSTSLQLSETATEKSSTIISDGFYHKIYQRSNGSTFDIYLTTTDNVFYADVNKLNKLGVITNGNLVYTTPENYNYIEDYDYYSYNIGGNVLYTKTELDVDVNCYSDPKFITLVSTVFEIDKTNSKVTLLANNEESVKYFRVINYTLKSGLTEPTWDSPNIDGLIPDGKLFWKETVYPVRSLHLADNTYAEFKTNIVVS